MIRLTMSAAPRSMTTTLSELACFLVPAAACTAVALIRSAKRRVATAKCLKIRSDGVGRLQMLMDFDRTMTTFGSESSYGVIEQARSEDVKAEARAMFDHYYPIETCHERSTAEKIPHMKEWYQRAHDLFRRDGVRLTDIAHAVSSGNVQLRPGVTDIIDFSRRTKVPVIVFSAGVGNVVEGLLTRHCGELPATVAVVSNYMNFDEEGNLIGWTEPLVHMYNKDESHLRSSKMHAQLVKRKNVILVGDSLGDVTMGDGLPHETMLKIGLLHHKVEQFIDKYTDAFDIVLLNDAPLHELVALLHELEATSTPDD